MALIDQKSDLKKLKYSNFATYGTPPIVKDINNPPKYNRVSKQATARVDDALRMARLLTANRGKLSPSAANFLATQGTIALVNSINAVKNASKGERGGAVLKAVGSTAADAGKTIAGLLVQTPVAGTGTHFIFPPAVGNQYLTNGGPGSGGRAFLQAVGNITGVLSGDGKDGAKAALEGSKIILDSTPEAGKNGVINFSGVSGESGINSKKSKIRDTVEPANKGEELFTKLKPGLEVLDEGNNRVVQRAENTSSQIFKEKYTRYSSFITTRNILEDGTVEFINGITEEDNINREESTLLKNKVSELNQRTADLEKSKEDINGKFNPDFSRGFKKLSKDENGILQNDERVRKAVWTRFTGDQGKYESSDPVNGKSAIDSFNSKGILDANLVQGLANNDLFLSDYDIIPFEFQIFDPSFPNNQRYLYFRAYLGSFNDDYSSDWNSTKYIGRAENLYNYSGFNRSISFDFKLAALTKEELIPIYEKLNYFVGSTSPSYSDGNAFMRGVFSKLTVGDYLQQVPGFFNKISVNWNTAYPWEVGYDENIDQSTIRKREVNSEGVAEEVDVSLPRNPTILDVSVGYTPVHNFNPAIGKNFIGTARSS